MNFLFSIFSILAFTNLACADDSILTENELDNLIIGASAVSIGVGVNDAGTALERYFSAQNAYSPRLFDQQKSLEKMEASMDRLARKLSPEITKQIVEIEEIEKSEKKMQALNPKERADLVTRKLNLYGQLLSNANGNEEYNKLMSAFHEANRAAHGNPRIVYLSNGNKAQSELVKKQLWSVLGKRLVRASIFTGVGAVGINYAIGSDSSVITSSEFPKKQELKIPSADQNREKALSVDPAK